jgi:hypothetical protein
MPWASQNLGGTVTSTTELVDVTSLCPSSDVLLTVPPGVPYGSDLASVGE